MFVKQYNNVIKLALKLPAKTATHIIEDMMGNMNAKQVILKGYYINGQKLME